ncbi:MAG TPA: PQQ-binding-like beta-propeller repeat protein [Pseudonocardiaceae bacterium]|nr:PQQ-binding-like beta-propeller repeat protein [Pseudonocardiaceae bacterium]
MPRNGVLLVVAIMLFATAVTVEINSWVSLAGEAGGACGGRYGACPRGTVLSSLLPLPVALITLPVVVVGLFRSGWLTRGLSVLALVAGFLAGQQTYAWLHGTTLHTVWQAPFDTSDELTTEGSWTDGGALIRVRLDQVVAYAEATGAARWTYTVPGRDVVCALSRTTDGHVGLVGYGGEQGRCGQLVALDLTTGRPLWTEQIDTDGLPDGPVADLVAAAGPIAAVLTATELVGRDLRSGQQLWSVPVPGDCELDSVTGGATLVLIDNCDQQHDYHVLDLDPATGKQRWSTAVPDADPESDSLRFLASAPITLDLAQTGARGTDTVYALGDSGRISATIPASAVSAPSGRTKLDTDEHSFDAQPIDWTFVDEGDLVGLTEQNDGGQDVLAYRLSDGRPLWSTELSDDAQSIAPDGDHVLVLDDERPTPVLWSLALAGGGESVAGLVSADLLGPEPRIMPVGGRFALVNQAGTEPTPPVVMLGG